MGRKQKKYHFIYKTTNLINDKFYIGMHSTDDLNDKYIGSGKRLWYSINKYGINNFKFEILEFISNRKKLKEREKEIVNDGLLLNEKCLNIKIGGGCGFTLKQCKNGRKISDEKLFKKYGSNYKSVISRKFHDFLTPDEKIKFINKIKEGQLNYDHITFLNKKHTEKTKKEIGLANSISQIGIKNSQYGTMWIHNSIRNKKIKKDEFISYLNDGWIKGRKMNLRGDGVQRLA